MPPKSLRVKLVDWDASWKDGVAVCLLLNRVAPSVCNTDVPPSPVAAWEKAVHALDSLRGIPDPVPAVVAADMASPFKPSDQAMFAVVALCRDLLRQQQQQQ